MVLIEDIDSEEDAASQNMPHAGEEEGAACESMPHIFVYGSLRPDDDSGMPWTQSACEGMLGQKAVISTATLYQDDYAVAVMNTDAADEGRVVGWVFTHPDTSFFLQKLSKYDKIEGFNSKDPEASFYDRTVTTACLQEEVREGQEQQIGKPGDMVSVFIYHRTDACVDILVPEGDWLKRDRSNDWNTRY